MQGQKNYSEFYATLNAVYGHKCKNLHPVRTKSGVLLSSSEDIRDRWVEHFSELLNLPTDVEWDITDEIEEYPIMEELEPVAMTEVETAINNTRHKKSPGPDSTVSYQRFLCIVAAP